MLFSKEAIIPRNFEDYVTETDGLPTMPTEHAFSFSINFKEGAEKRTWQRVWYVTDLSTELLDIEIAKDPLETLNMARKHQMHRFKSDIIRFLKINHSKLEVIGDSLVLIPRSK